MAMFVVKSVTAKPVICRGSAMFKLSSSFARSTGHYCRQEASRNGSWTVTKLGRNQRLQLTQMSVTRSMMSGAKVAVCFPYNKDKNCSIKTQCRTFTEDRKTTALTLIKDLKHLKSSPIPALVLGLGGVVPFVAAPGYMILSSCYMANIAFTQVAYGATILSFLGGVRWGLTVSPSEEVKPDWFNLGYSVTPSLVAWVGLLLPTSASIFVLITGLVGTCFMDVTMWGYPPWFKALRFLLTFLAVLSLWTTLMCRLLLKAESKSEKKVEKERKSWFRLPWKNAKVEVDKTSNVDAENALNMKKDIIKLTEESNSSVEDPRISPILQGESEITTQEIGDN